MGVDGKYRYVVASQARVRPVFKLCRVFPEHFDLYRIFSCMGRRAMLGT